MFVFVLIYLFLCFVVATLGIKRGPGFFWSFLLSILVTPVVMLLFFWFGRSRRRSRLDEAYALVAEHEQKQKDLNGK